MKTRATIAVELRQALRAIEMTPTFLQAVRTGSVSADDLIQFLDDALAVAIDQAYLDFAERAGGVKSIRQVASAERAVLLRDMADASLDLVQGVAGRAKESWSDEKLSRELKRAVLMNAKDAKAAETYDDELRRGDPKAKRRKLRDRRFAQKTDMSAARRRLMVGRYSERLIAHRTAAIARDAAATAEAVTTLSHWTERAEEGDAEAIGARKFWVNREDGKVRDSHVYVAQDYPDGLPLDQPFVTKWGNMRYPHDSQGHRNDRDGCRCKLRIEKART